MCAAINWVQNLEKKQLEKLGEWLVQLLHDVLCLRAKQVAAQQWNTAVVFSVRTIGMWCPPGSLHNTLICCICCKNQPNKTNKFKVTCQTKDDKHHCSAHTVPFCTFFVIMYFVMVLAATSLTTRLKSWQPEVKPKQSESYSDHCHIEKKVYNSLWAEPHIKHFKALTS